MALISISMLSVITPCAECALRVIVSTPTSFCTSASKTMFRGLLPSNSMFCESCLNFTIPLALLMLIVAFFTLSFVCVAFVANTSIGIWNLSPTLSARGIVGSITTGALTWIFLELEP